MPPTQSPPPQCACHATSALPPLQGGQFHVVDKITEEEAAAIYGFDGDICRGQSQRRPRPSPRSEGKYVLGKAKGVATVNARLTPGGTSSRSAAGKPFSPRTCSNCSMSSTGSTCSTISRCSSRWSGASSTSSFLDFSGSHQRSVLFSDVECRLTLSFHSEDLRATTAELEAEEDAVHSEIIELQHEHEKLTKDVSILVSSPRGSCSPRDVSLRHSPRDSLPCKSPRALPMNGSPRSKSLRPAASTRTPRSPTASGSPRLDSPSRMPLISMLPHKEPEDHHIKVDVIQNMKEIKQLETQISVAKRHEAHVCALKAQHYKLYETRLGTWLTMHFLVASVHRFHSLHFSTGARAVLKSQFVPRYRLRRSLRVLRAVRQLLTRAFLRKMSKPTVQELKAGKLFSTWPPRVLERVIRNLTPVVFRRVGSMWCLKATPGQ